MDRREYNRRWERARTRKRHLAAGRTDAPRNWWTVTRASIEFGRHPLTIAQWCREGRIEARRALNGRDWRIRPVVDNNRRT